MQPLGKSKATVDTEQAVRSGVSHFRIAFIGDPSSGKSQVRRAYVQLSTSKESIEQVDSNVARVRGYLVELLTVDRESEFEKIPRMIRCSHLDAVILFYDISNPTQFERAHNQWIPLVKRLYPGTPFLISATGIEGRTDKVQRGNALRAEIEKMKRNLAAPEYSSDESSDSTLGTSTVGSVTSSSSGLRETDSAPASPNSPYLMRRMNFSPTRKKFSANEKSTFRKVVPTQLGQYLASHYGACAFREVSYRTYEGIQDLLEDTVNHIVRADKMKFSLVRSRVGLPLPRHTYRI